MEGSNLAALLEDAALKEWAIGIGVVLGLFFGSFLNVVIYRLPRGESLSFPGSHCTNCGAKIRAYENIPVLSWLVLRGRARCCKTHITARYPLVELLGGLLAWALLSTQILTLDANIPIWHASLLFLLEMGLGLAMIALAFIDLEYMILPDPITLGGVVVGVLTAELRPGQSWASALLGAVFGFVLIWLPFCFGYAKLRGQAGMGLGDAKLVALAGAWFGWAGALFALLAGAVQATVIAVSVYAVAGRIREPIAVQREREALKQTLQNATPEERSEIEQHLADDPLAHEAKPGFGQARLAFGPFLALATVEYLLLGEWLIDQYWNIGTL